MYFENEAQRDELIIDQKTLGFFRRIANADYALYQQDGNVFEFVARAGGITKNRYKGLRWRAQLNLRLEDGDLRLPDHVQVLGHTSVSYQLQDTSKIVYLDAISLGSAIIGQVLDSLMLACQNLTSASISQSQVSIKMRANAHLNRVMDDCGYLLVIEHFSPSTQIDKAIEAGTVSTIETRYEATNKTILAEADAGRVRILAHAEADRIMVLLAPQRAQLELEAKHARDLMLLETEHAERQLQLLLRKISTLTQLPLDYAMAAILLMEPSSASALAQIAQDRANLRTRDDALNLLSQYIGGRPAQQGAAPGSLTAPSSPPVLITNAPSDPIKAAIEAQGYQITLPSQMYQRYLVSFGSPPYYLSFAVQHGSIENIKHGSTNRPQNSWHGAIINPQDPAASALSIIDELRRSLKR